MKPHMHLMFDVSWAHMEGRWRMPGSWTNRSFPDIEVYEEIARIAERGLIDMIFCGDGTGGRVAFNVITSTRRADAANYGFDELMEHNSRYDRLEEFIEVCRKLWDSVEPDAMLWDHETGVVADPSKVHAINHDGRFFKVRGPLNTSPSPQHHPIIIQAGGSPRGLKASAKVADHIFAANKPLEEKVRHRMEETFEETGNRGGFMIAHPPATPRDFLNVVDFLVPELQRRGRFRRAYAGKTLRENLAM